MKNLILLALVFMTVPAHAQDKGGNGGGYVLMFKHIRDATTQWISSNLKAGTLDQKLKLSDHNLTAETLVMKYQMAVASVGNNIDIRPGKVLIGPLRDKPRPCGNFEGTRIECSQSDWTTAMQLKFMGYLYSLVLHEYLGIAGIEENDGQNSTFPISSRLVTLVDEIETYRAEIEKNFINADICSGLLYLDVSNDAGRIKQMREVMERSHYHLTYSLEEATHTLIFAYLDDTDARGNVLNVTIKDRGNHVVLSSSNNTFDGMFKQSNFFDKLLRQFSHDLERCR